MKDIERKLTWFYESLIVPRRSRILGVLGFFVNAPSHINCISCSHAIKTNPKEIQSQCGVLV